LATYDILVSLKTFAAEFIKSKSAAAAGLCSWVINIVKFFDVYCDVEPKRRALDEANAELLAARQKLTAVKNKVSRIMLFKLFRLE
jgi:dynein heavy chain, axonemal